MFFLLLRRWCFSDQRLHKSPVQSDQRRYNAPTTNEVAMVFVNEDGEPPFARDIWIYQKNPEDPNQQFINLNMNPMTYAILYLHGEPG